jgi:hypothetical protein
VQGTSFWHGCSAVTMVTAAEAQSGSWDCSTARGSQFTGLSLQGMQNNRALCDLKISPSKTATSDRE